MRKGDGETNLADFGAKDVEEVLIVRFVGGMGFKEDVGSHPEALKVSRGLGGYREEGLLAQTDDASHTMELLKVVARGW
eukprot:7077781-Pyramimonas_sp.AAC.1